MNKITVNNSGLVEQWMTHSFDYQTQKTYTHNTTELEYTYKTNILNIQK